MKADINKITPVVILILIVVLLKAYLVKFGPVDYSGIKDEPVQEELLGDGVTNNQEDVVSEPAVVNNGIGSIKPSRVETVTEKRVNIVTDEKLNINNKTLTDNQQQIKLIQQQILDIKKQYYIDFENLKNSITPSQQKVYDSIKIHQDELNKLTTNIVDVTTNPEYSIDTGVGLGNRIAVTQGLKIQSLNYEIQADNRSLQRANQEKQSMLDLLLTTANQKLEQLNLQIEQLQLNNQY